MLYKSSMSPWGTDRAPPHHLQPLIKERAEIKTADLAGREKGTREGARRTPAGRGPAYRAGGERERGDLKTLRERSRRERRGIYVPDRCGVSWITPQGVGRSVRQRDATRGLLR